MKILFFPDKKQIIFLKKLGDKYNNPASIYIISQVQKKTEDVKSTMHKNIELALENCVKLDYLELKTEELQHNSIIFKKMLVN